MAQSNLVEPTELTVQEQPIRALLREKFLRFISTLPGRECQVNLFENSQQTCTIRAVDPYFQNIIVENLSTNSGQTLDRAILRTCDIISMHFDDIHHSSFNQTAN